MIKHHLLLVICWTRDSREALGNEFSFQLASIRGLGLLEGLSATGTAFTNDLELAHVFAITLDLFLLGVDTATIQGSAEGHWLSNESRTRRSESLKKKKNGAKRGWEKSGLRGSR
jgi:hypothetical protein